ncbi:NADPH oxidase 5 [Manacus vitellinus]|uniref:NADPH oxidase 5 n=1 Tax=Manacus vitellinus TaxID=328815 RepID=UPI00115E518E|nr:NADPH oxidase 5 [Manacus vitellinus]
MGTAGDAEWLRWVTKQFGNIAGKDKEISLEEFKRALQVKESFFAERFFALFDADGSGTISLEELLRALRLLVHGDQRDKLSFLFQVYDVDGSGSIEAEELQLVLRWCLRESSVSLPEERLGDLTRALLEAADRDHSGSITFPELQEQLEAFPELMENLTIRFGVSGLFSPAGIRGKVFYWTHLSYISVWTLLILHGPHFWKWFLVPGSLFVLEKVLGWAWRRAGGLHIVEVNLLPSKVTHLVIQRPPSFHFKPGDYVYLNVPAIASYEWHPFSISSAPEQPETLWLHIRSLGQWTNRLYEYFQQLESPSLEPNPAGRSRSWAQEGSVASGRDGSVQLTAFRATAPGQDPERGGSTSPGETRRLCSVKCFLDGPYGTPTRRIFLSEHAVLIGAGIGITPFASILQSIMYRYRRRRQSCPRCHHSWCEELRDQDMTLRKVDFIWINRDQKHFEWFLSLLSKLEREQAELEPGGRFLELHLYMTSALARSDVKALGLQVALDLLAAKEKRDSITGLRTRTQPGRPDWGKVFGKVAQEQVGKVQVFFCGSPALAKVIRGHCERFGFRFSRENF